jgi:4-amino-4-deoxy-L-arabinose transferase-like glycosyltransferase
MQPIRFLNLPLWSHYLGCLGIAAIGCFLSWHFLGFSDQSNPDFVDFYYPVAQNIVAGDGVTLNGAPALAYPPGYPVIIAGVLQASKALGFSKEFANRLFVMLCYMGCSVLIYLSAGLFWESKTALIISCLWSCMPLTLFLNKTTSSEQPYMVIFYGCLLLFFTGLRVQRHRIPLFFAIGVLCGIAMLIRPIAIGLGGILIIMLILYRSLKARTKMVLAISIIAGTTMTILPWEGWVFQKTGRIIMLCKGRDSFSIYDGLTFAISSRPFRITGKDVPVPADVRLFMEKTLLYYGTASSTEDLLTFVTEYAHHQPITVGKLILIKAARSWYGTCSNKFEKQVLIMQMLFLIGLSVAVMQLWRFYPDMRYLLICCIIMVCYFWALTIMVLSIARYMMPVASFLIILFPALWKAKSVHVVQAQPETLLFIQ